MEPSFGFQEEIKNLRHSGVGIASFVISLIAIIILLGLILLAILTEAIGISADSQEILYLIIGFSAIILGLLSIIGIVLGIIGVFQEDRKRVFSILGLIINAVPVLTMIYLII